MPATMVDAEVIRNAVRLACRAPSLHNSQPWRWVLESEALQLFEDADRVVHATDHSGREALMAAVPYSTTSGWQWPLLDGPPMSIGFPTRTTLYTWLRSTSAPMEFVTDGHRQRADAILQRRTDRLPFAAPPDWDSVESALREHRYLRRRPPRHRRRRSASASWPKPPRLTESLRLYDSSYHAELEWWTGSFRGV